MGSNHRRERYRAVPINTALRAANAAGFERGQYSFRRSEDRVPKLERLLHEQICARRVLALCARGITRPKSSCDQRLSGCDRHRYLEPGRGPLAARTNDERSAGCRCSGVRLSAPYGYACRKHYALEPGWKSVIDHTTLPLGKSCSHCCAGSVLRNAALLATTGHRPVATAHKVLIP